MVCIGESIVSLININNGIKEFTFGCQICNNILMLIFNGYFKVRESLYTQVVIWVDLILNHVDTRAILLEYECSCMVYKPKGYHGRRKKPFSITCTLMV